MTERAMQSFRLRLDASVINEDRHTFDNRFNIRIKELMYTLVYTYISNSQQSNLE